MDSVPDVIDHATLGAARWGRNGWGGALLMRDVGDRARARSATSRSARRTTSRFLDAPRRAVGAATWGWHRRPRPARPTACGGRGSAPGQLDGESALGFPEAGAPHRRPRAGSASPPGRPADVRDGGRRAAPRPVTAVGGRWPRPRRRSSTATGSSATSARRADGRTVLLDWAYPGEGPVCHELAWYLALNRARLPVGPHARSRRSPTCARRSSATASPPTAGGSASSPLCLLGGARAVRLGEGLRRRRRARLVVRPGPRGCGPSAADAWPSAYTDATGAGVRAAGPGRVYNHLAEVLTSLAPLPLTEPRPLSMSVPAQEPPLTSDQPSRRSPDRASTSPTAARPSTGCRRPPSVDGRRQLHSRSANGTARRRRRRLRA